MGGSLAVTLMNVNLHLYRYLCSRVSFFSYIVWDLGSDNMTNFQSHVSSYGTFEEKREDSVCFNHLRHRVKSGNFGLQVNSDSDRVCFIF